MESIYIEEIEHNKESFENQMFQNKEYETYNESFKKNIENKIIKGSYDHNLIKFVLMNNMKIKFTMYCRREKFYDTISNYSISNDDIKYYLCYVVKHNINIINQSIEIRKKLGSMVLDNIDKSYFNNTNNFKGFIFDDDTFRNIFKDIIFKKRIDKDFQLRNYKYELDKENWIISEICYDAFSRSGIWFCQEYNIKKYVNHGPVEIIVTIPKSYKSYWICIEEDKLKSECIFLQSEGIIVNKKS